MSVGMSSISSFRPCPNFVWNNWCVFRHIMCFRWLFMVWLVSERVKMRLQRKRLRIALACILFSKLYTDPCYNNSTMSNSKTETVEDAGDATTQFFNSIDAIVRPSWIQASELSWYHSSIYLQGERVGEPGMSLLDLGVPYRLSSCLERDTRS